MPTITKLSAQKRVDYVNLYVDDKFYCGLSLNQVAAHRLHKGQILSNGELLQLRDEAETSKAYAAALRYLGLRIRSEKELRDYLLRKGFEVASNSVVERLKNEHYLDDEDFAQRWSAMRFEQARSPQAVRMELIKKGIARETIDTLFATDQAPQTEISIIRLAEKKQRRGSVPQDKLMAYLAGRGFRYDEIKSALAARPDLFENV